MIKKMNIEQMKKALYNVSEEWDGIKVKEVMYGKSDKKYHYFYVITDKPVFAHQLNYIRYKVDINTSWKLYQRGNAWYHDGSLESLVK